MTEKEMMATLIKIAANRAQGHSLMPLYALCEGQRTVSTARLERLLDEIAEKDTEEAYELRKVANGIRMADKP